MNNKHDNSTARDLFIAIFLFLIIGGVSVVKNADKIKMFIYQSFYKMVAVIIGINIFLLLLLILIVTYYVKKKRAEKERVSPNPTAYLKKHEGGIFLGYDDKGEELWIYDRQRRTHIDIPGSSGSGKTASGITPFVVGDIKRGKGYGFLMVDGKPEINFISNLVGHIKKSNRIDDFYYFSLSFPELSCSYNPFISTGIDTPSQIGSKIFSAWEEDMIEPYYRNEQKRFFFACVEILQKLNMPLSFKKIYELTYKQKEVLEICEKAKQQNNIPKVIIETLEGFFIEMYPNQRQKILSGLQGILVSYIQGELADLLNVADSDINLKDILEKGKIIYCDLPSMANSVIIKQIGKIILQDIQNSLALRHSGFINNKNFFSIIADEFATFAYEGFADAVAKSRSANCGIVIAHQSIGDFEKISRSFAAQLIQNTATALIFRLKSPNDAEFYSKTFGGRKFKENISRRKEKRFFFERETGESTVAFKEETYIEPSQLQSLGVGEGYVIIPRFDNKGMRGTKVNFVMPENSGITWEETRKILLKRKEDIKFEKLKKLKAVG